MRIEGIERVGGHLQIGGCDTTELAKEYGTPLYIMNEDTIRKNCRKFKQSIENYYQGNGIVTYTSKAFVCKEMCRLIMSEGLDLEVVSAGELYTALEAGVPPEIIHFQGNNKSYKELEMAIDNAVGDIVLDNYSELMRIQQLLENRDKEIKISIRVKPGIDAHTHELIRTGAIDSKFGVALETGEAYRMVQRISGMKNIRLMGLHCHIGSQIMDTEPFVLAAEVMLGFYGKLKKELGIELPMLNLGGGFGIPYVETDKAVSYDEYMAKVSVRIHALCREYGLAVPKIVIEPGRSIVGEAGITLYTVGDVKEIPGVRNYVAIDGGMFENPRYSLYRAQYDCVVASRADEDEDYTATIAGKCCETDLIQEHVSIAKPRVGDILAVLCTGGYNYSMASNYNRNPRPPVIMVSKGKSRVAVRGETYADLISHDV